MWGDEYHYFVRVWWEHLQTLERVPDQIILVTDRPRPDIPCEQIVNPPYGKHQEAGWWTAGINALDTVWRGTLGIDDKLLENCYVGLPSSEVADCWPLGFIEQPVTRIHIPPVFSAAELLAMTENPLGHVSPFTERVWKLIGSEYPDVAYSDWTVYREIAKVGGRFVPSEKVGFLSYRRIDSLSHKHALDADRHRKEAQEYERPTPDAPVSAG